MKNLKKVLALVMACAMLFTVSSFAFTDVEEDASYLEAVTLLSKLGIINGYEDGTFLPDNTITRAEIAKVLVCALNATEQAEGAKADNIFTDVPASHWAAGYVNYAANLGIINGRGNGIYDPEAPVTYEEAVKLIVAMLGYTPVANVKGGYPTGYLYAANQVMKITKGATGTSGDAAKRWVVARLIYNALECRIMEQETWSAADPEFIKGSDTLLDDYLDITKLEAIVTETFMEDFNDKEDQDVWFRVSKVNGNQVYSTEEIDGEEEEVPYFDIYFDANGTGAEEYLGYNVVAYVQAYGEGDEELVAVAPKAGKNATLQIALGDINADEIDPLATKNYFSFEYFVDDDNTKTVKALDSIAFYENGILNDTEDALFDAIAGYGEEYDGADGVITLLDNDGNGVYDYAFLEEISKEIVVDEITKRTYKVTSKNDAGSVKLDPEDEESYVTFYKDGKVASFDDIAEDDVLSIVETEIEGDVKVQKVYISSEKVEGYVSSTSAAGYKIDGNVYKKSSFYEETISRRDSGIFYINYNGRIAFTDTEAEIGGNYGFLLAVNTNVSFSSGVDYTLRFMNTKGEWIDAKLAETITVTAFDGEDMHSEKITDLDEDIADIAAASNNWLVTETDEDGVEELVMSDALTNRVFQYTLNSNGELAKIVVADSTLTEDNFSYEELDDEYDELGNRFKGQTFKGGVDKNTVVFKVALKGDDPDTIEEDPQLITDTLKKSQITVADYTLFADEEAYEGFIYDYANDAYKCMVITNAGTTIAKDAKLLVVSTVEITSNDDEEDYILIEGYMDGEKVTLESVADDALESAMDIAVLGEPMADYDDIETYVDGAVFEVALDGEGKITDINVIFAADDLTVAGELTGNEDDEMPYYFFGAIATEKMTSSSAKFIQLYDIENEEFLVDGEEEKIDFATAGSLMKGNIYNVDLTGRKAKFDVADSIADYVGTVIFDEYEDIDLGEMDGEDVNFALVKVLEDEVIDIVVYTIEYAYEA